MAGYTILLRSLQTFKLDSGYHDTEITSLSHPALLYLILLNDKFEGQNKKKYTQINNMVNSYSQALLIGTFITANLISL